MEKLHRLVVILFCSIAFTLLINRLLRGVDLTDEAYYLAQPWIFINGAKPFWDELMLVQTASFFTAPILFIYNFFKGGIEGAFLYFRLVYIGLLAFVGVTYFSAFKDYLSKRDILVCCLFLFCFWPFSIPSLSYNTLGATFFCVGQILCYVPLSRKKANMSLIIGLNFLVFSVWVYPTLALPLAGVLFSLLIKRKDLIWEKGSKRLLYFFSVFYVVLATYLLFFYIGVERLMEIRSYFSSYSVQGGGRVKFTLIFNQLVESYSYFGLMFFYWGVIYFSRKKTSQVAVLLICFGGYLFWLSQQVTAIPQTHLIFSVLALNNMFVVLLNIKNKKFSALDFTILISLFAGLVTSWTSSNGFSNFIIGSLFSTLYALVFLFSELHISYKRKFATIFISLIVTFQINSLYKSVYGDDFIVKNLKYEIEDGPYKGLYTGKKKKLFLKKISMDLSKLNKGSSSLIVDSFPVGYLLSTTRYYAASVWPYSLSQFDYKREAIVDFYTSELPEYLIWVHKIPVSESFQFNLEHFKKDILRDILLPKYELMIKQDEYNIFKLKN
jgi:hypothetical protein